MNTIQEALHELRQRPVIHETKKSVVVKEYKNCNEGLSDEDKAQLAEIIQNNNDAFAADEIGVKIDDVNIDDVIDYTLDDDGILTVTFKDGRKVTYDDNSKIEECDQKPANYVDEDLEDIDDVEYLESAKDYAKEIGTFDEEELAKVEADYNFAEHGPEDEAEQIIFDAIEARKAQLKEALTEDVASTMPATPLPVGEVKDFILSLPEPDPHVPPRFFKLGYIKELASEIPSKFRGGRGSEGQPHVRIFKCTEYSALYTGSDWKGTNATKAADKVLGTERHTGEKTGFNFGGEGNVVNRIGTYKDGSEALQAYIGDQSKQKTKFFISLDDEDLHEASRDEIAQYLTPAFAARILNPTHAAAGVDAEGNAVYDKPINRFKLTNIYMIGNHGHSIM